jgi:DNA-directed RNA polymerase specialized sigma24 family protein
MPTSNDLLVWAFIGGDEQAFDELVRRSYRQIVRSVCRAGCDLELVHDSVLEALVKLQAHIGARREKYGSDAQRYDFNWFWALSVKASRNRYLDHIRRQRTTVPTVPLIEDVRTVARLMDVGDRGLPEPVSRAIARWSERDPAFRMMLSQVAAGATYPEAATAVAAQTGRSYSSVRMMFQRYCQHVREEAVKELAPA